jgi:glycosyltransferase involved in cell wall biosynthesis
MDENEIWNATKMKIAIVNLTGGGLSGGYRKYLKNMLPRLANHNAVSALLCISPEGNDVGAWFHEKIAVEYGACSPLAPSHFAHNPDRKMADCLMKFSPDMIFLPVERFVRFHHVPVVNMVQNMEPYVLNFKGDPLREKYKKYVQRKLAGNSLKLADHTIAISGFVKDYLLGILNIPGEKISRVYHGLTLPRIGNGIRPVSLPPGWDGGFIFTCGSIRPARGLEDAVTALRELKAENLNLRLVIAGETVPGMRKYRAGLERSIASAGLTDSVFWVGMLNDDAMRWCYETCRIFIMTSRVEACPNIVLEAMNYGCVCISTDSLPMPEFFGDAAVYYTHGDGKSLFSAIQSTLSWSDKQRKELSERAQKRAAFFSWDKCAENTVAVLKKAIKREG